MRLIWGNREAKYFSHEIWTTQISLIAFGNFLFWRKRFSQPEAGRGTTSGNASGKSVVKITQRLAD
jgi:hypothetical protein